MKKIRQFLSRLIPACIVGAIIGIAAATWLNSSEQEPSSSFRTDHYTFELYDGLTFDDVESLAQAFEQNHGSKSDTSTIRIWRNQITFLKQMQQSTGEALSHLRIYSPTETTLCLLLTRNV